MNGKRSPAKVSEADAFLGSSPDDEKPITPTPRPEFNRLDESFYFWQKVEMSLSPAALAAK